MIREPILTISTLLAFVAVSGVANADPTLTRKSTPSKGSPFNQTRQTHPNYRARALQEGAPPAQILLEGTSRQPRCRYLYSGGPGGPKSTLPVTC
jgi:hypothetical protein